MQSLTGAEADVHRLLNPSSVAVVGASSRPGALSWWPVHLLQHCGFAGRIYPVNPKYDKLEGEKCYASIADVPEQVDLAIIVLNVDGTLAAMRDCAAAGVKAVVLPTQGFGELGEEGRAKERKLKEIADSAGIRIVGSNTDGFANIASGAVVSIQPLFEENIPGGPIGVVTQSGATAASLLVRLKEAGMGAKLHVSAGNETDLGLADYMSVLVQDPDIKIVLAFVESVRRPDDFVKVAALAAELGKPIALIKVGRSEEGARRAGAHTGALAGSDELYDALFAKWGVIRVGELSELVAVAKLYLGVGEVPYGGVGILSGSGGQCGVAADAAKTAGVLVPTLAPEIEKRIDDRLTFGAGFNPCDLTGEIARTPSLAAEVYQEFSADEQIATVVYVRKKLLADVSERSVRPLLEAAAQPGSKPLAIYAMDGFVAGVEAELYEEAGTPVFYSLHELYTAFRGLAGRTRAISALRAQSAASQATRSPLELELLPGAALEEESSRTLLARYELAGPREAFVANADGAARAAQQLGFPVVLKISDPRITHKTEIGGVVVGLMDADQVAAAAREVLDRGRAELGDEPKGLLVQEQVQDAVEVIAGLKLDPEFGPFVLVGLGGVTAEALKDVVVRPAPVTEDEAMEMFEGLRGVVLLKGFRGAPPRDLPALAALLSRLSQLGVDGKDVLAEVDLNPVAVLPEGEGVRVLDSLFIAADR